MKKDLEFLFEIGTMRFIQRTWKQFLNPDVANLAEHTMRVIWIALVLAKMEGAGDTEKIMKMALAHDVSETRTGDVHYVSRLYTERHEEKAVHDTFSGSSLAEEFLPLLEEYERRESLEAKIVKDADTLDVDMEMRERWAQSEAIYNALAPARLKTKGSLMLTESGRRLWQAVYEADPHDWHSKGANRFTKGDWEDKAAES